MKRNIITIIIALVSTFVDAQTVKTIINFNMNGECQ